MNTAGQVVSGFQFFSSSQYEHITLLVLHVYLLVCLLPMKPSVPVFPMKSGHEEKETNGVVALQINYHSQC